MTRVTSSATGEGQAWWCEWYRLLLHTAVDTELCNYIFMCTVAYYEAGQAGSRQLTSRDLVTLLLAIECVYLFGPLATLLNEGIFGDALPPIYPLDGTSVVEANSTFRDLVLSSAGWSAPYYPSLYFGTPAWFLLTIFVAKVYITLGSGLGVPGWAQCALLLGLLLVCFGTVVSICGSNDSYTPVSFIVNLIGFYSSRTYEPTGRTCAALLSFESTQLAAVRVYDIGLFCFFFHFGPRLVSLAAARGGAAKRWAADTLRAGFHRCVGSGGGGQVMDVGARLAQQYPRSLATLGGACLFVLALTLTLLYVDGTHCQGWESGIFHPSLYNRHTLSASWSGEKMTHLRLEWPQWFSTNHAPASCNPATALKTTGGTCELGRCCGDFYDVPVDSPTLPADAPWRTARLRGNLTCAVACAEYAVCCMPQDATNLSYNQGTVCALGNVMIYTVAIMLIGAAFACCTCVHMKLTGSTTLGAYLVQPFLFSIPAIWQDSDFGRTFYAGEPFEHLDVVLWAAVILVIGGPLMQWYVILPQITALRRISGWLSNWWEEHWLLEWWEEDALPTIDRGIAAGAARIEACCEAMCGARRWWGERTPLLPGKGKHTDAPLPV